MLLFCGHTHKSQVVKLIFLLQIFRHEYDFEISIASDNVPIKFENLTHRIEEYIIKI